MKENTESLLDKLATADPEIAKMVAAGLVEREEQVSLPVLSLLVDDVIWALTQEHSFGISLATGYLSLIQKSKENNIPQYHNVVRTAGEEGRISSRPEEGNERPAERGA